MKNKYKGLDISFQDVDFDKFGLQNDQRLPKAHHTHLYTKGNKINLVIGFDGKTSFGLKFGLWSETISWKSFGALIITEKIYDKVILRIDSSNISLTGFRYKNDGGVNKRHSAISFCGADNFQLL